MKPKSGATLICGNRVADVVSCQRMGVRVTKKSKTEFAKKLKNWRYNEGMSQSQAAALLGVSVRSLQNWEIARTKPSTLAERLMDRLLLDRPKTRSHCGADSFV